MAKILITGGAGYIGSHMTREMCKHDDVTVLDNLSTGNEKLIWGEAEFVNLDLRDREAILDFFINNKFDAVIHFAALSAVGESMEQPELYEENNVQGSINLLDGMKAGGCRKIIFSSTAATYGEPEEMPITEETPTNPINPYGETKLAIEKEMHARAEKGELDFVILRYFNVAGASEDARLGEMRENETHLIPLIFERAKAGKPLYIFGNDYPTPDGTCVRDYIHVLDLVDGHLLALDYLEKEGGAHIFNLGSGCGFSVKEVLEVCKWVCGIDFEIIEADRRAGDPPVLIASPEKAKNILKWNVNRSLEQICRDAWNWFNK